MKGIGIVKAVGLALIVSGILFFAAGPTSQAGNRCTDRCADRSKVMKDTCKLIPFKTERKICERRVKEAKEDCKRRCR